MADVEFGFVHDFGADEEFMARRGEGATLDREPVRVSAAAEPLEVVGVESAEPEWSLPALEALAGKVFRLRVVGAIAISAAYVAAGRFDAMLSLRSCRSVDAAAAQLIVREAGGAVAFGEDGLSGALRDLESRYPKPRNRPSQAVYKRVFARTHVRYTRALSRPQSQSEEVFFLYGRSKKQRQQIENAGQARHYRSEKVRGQNRVRYETRRDQGRCC
jgi:hypothetical protein